MKAHDVIIAGGGPIGLYLASLLEQKLDVLVLEKAKGFGKKADSGLYSTRLADFLPIQKQWVEHEVRGAVLHSPGGEAIELKKPSTASYVVNREKFTVWLSERVKSRILSETLVKEININGKVTVKTSKGTFESKMVVGCDGASSVVRKHFGIQPKEILNGIIGITKEGNHDPQVDIYFDKSLIRDGFFWKIPRGKGTEYGALGKNVKYSDMEKFFHIKEYAKHAAFMNLGYFPTAFSRAILVGEAAGQVKPWSLGGIVFGFTCSQIARDVIFQAFERQDFSEHFLQRYDRLWKKKIGGTIKTGMFFRGMFEKMDNEQLEGWFRRLKKLSFLSRLDMDFPALQVFG